jgi:branched-chain amino acid transport system ATP-binding protein
VNVRYGLFKAVSDLSLKIDKNEIVSVIGSNGAGKTTTLRTISGILHPESGQVIYMGQEISKLDPAEIVERGISHVPEGRRVFPYLTVEENLAMGAYSPRARKKMKESMRLVHNLFPRLKERMKQMACTLSGGEQQMLAIGRALMSAPSLLMLDEPSSGLAPNLVTMVFEKIAETNKEGVSILLVEQHAREALELANRAYVLETGHLTLEGKGEDLLNDERVRKAYLGL